MTVGWAGEAAPKLAAFVMLILTFAQENVVIRGRPPGKHIAVRKLLISVALSVTPAFAVWNCPV